MAPKNRIETILKRQLEGRKKTTINNVKMLSAKVRAHVLKVLLIHLVAGLTPQQNHTCQ